MKYKLSSLLIFFLIFCGMSSLKAQEKATVEEEDPFLWLEEVEGEKALDWVKSKNAETEKIISSQPGFEELKERYAEAFNDKDKIAYPEMIGDYVYNLWQDEIYERGLWRRMPKADYLNNKDNWEEVLDIDALSKKEGVKWVFKEANWLAPENKICLISLSDGGKDESQIREFDASTKSFVEDGLFFKESKGSVAWVDIDNVLIAWNFGEGTLTDSGYPRQVRHFKRGGSLEKAPVVFEIDSDKVLTAAFTMTNNEGSFPFVYYAPVFFESELHYFKNNELKKLNYPKMPKSLEYSRMKFFFL